MDDGEPTGAKKAVRWVAVAGGVIALLGILANVTGLFEFVTGKNLPDLFAPASTPPAVTTTTGARSTPAPSATPPAEKSEGDDVAVQSDQPVTPPPRTDAPPLTTTDAVKNFQLAVAPGEFPAAEPRTVTIETWDGGLNAFVDIEIADPAASGGVCPQLTSGPCNLIYSGGSQADGAGYSRTEFEWFGDTPGHDGIHHAGTYTITAQDRGTGAMVSIDVTAR